MFEALERLLLMVLSTMLKKLAPSKKKKLSIRYQSAITIPYLRPKWPQSTPYSWPKRSEAIPVGARHTYIADTRGLVVDIRKQSGNIMLLTKHFRSLTFKGYRKVIANRLANAMMRVASLENKWMFQAFRRFQTKEKILSRKWHFRVVSSSTLKESSTLENHKINTNETGKISK